MDAGFFGSVMTVLSFVIFVAIVWWAYHKGNKQKFEDAANLPFREGAEEVRKPD
ncbi:MAG TPA: cbb3-type cytochrome c oxidase subunit 3 [Thiobacillaceae bacterium]|nr:cbb3-type cytochrome c oxidase subunit 3 [Thiobacillaceae bacterium]HNH88074.1 cbb3-type cytochrome c oxidase subunit 3 [Thiobacillaceae bacterium]HNI07153.1 cbb3-type cytochrome c oxidase subunit 3 [Thiobacillaceae bacterium]